MRVYIKVAKYVHVQIKVIRGLFKIKKLNIKRDYCIIYSIYIKEYEGLIYRSFYTIATLLIIYT